MVPAAFNAEATPNPWQRISMAKQHRSTAMGAIGATKAEARRTAAPSSQAHCKFMALFRLSTDSCDASRVQDQKSAKRKRLRVEILYEQ